MTHQVKFRNADRTALVVISVHSNNRGTIEHVNYHGGICENRAEHDRLKRVVREMYLGKRMDKFNSLNAKGTEYIVKFGKYGKPWLQRAAPNRPLCRHARGARRNEVHMTVNVDTSSERRVLSSLRRNVDEARAALREGENVSVQAKVAVVDDVEFFDDQGHPVIGSKWINRKSDNLVRVDAEERITQETSDRIDWQHVTVIHLVDADTDWKEEWRWRDRAHFEELWVPATRDALAAREQRKEMKLREQQLIEDRKRAQMAPRTEDVTNVVRYNAAVAHAGTPTFPAPDSVWSDGIDRFVVTKIERVIDAHKTLGAPHYYISMVRNGVVRERFEWFSATSWGKRFKYTTVQQPEVVFRNDEVKQHYPPFADTSTPPAVGSHWCHRRGRGDVFCIERLEVQFKNREYDRLVITMQRVGEVQMTYDCTVSEWHQQMRPASAVEVEQFNRPRTTRTFRPRYIAPRRVAFNPVLGMGYGKDAFMRYAEMCKVDFSQGAGGFHCGGYVKPRETTLDDIFRGAYVSPYARLLDDIFRGDKFMPSRKLRSFTSYQVPTPRAKETTFEFDRVAREIEKHNSQWNQQEGTSTDNLVRAIRALHRRCLRATEKIDKLQEQDVQACRELLKISQECSTLREQCRNYKAERDSLSTQLGTAERELRELRGLGEPYDPVKALVLKFKQDFGVGAVHAVSAQLNVNAANGYSLVDAIRLNGEHVVKAFNNARTLLETKR